MQAAITKELTERRAIELFRLVHGKGDAGSESAFHAQNPALCEGWMKLGRLVLELEFGRRGTRKH